MTLAEALRVVIRDESLPDFVYRVRERVSEEDAEYTGSSWAHPRVRRFADACERLERELVALEEQQ